MRVEEKLGQLGNWIINNVANARNILELRRIMDEDIGPEHGEWWMSSGGSKAHWKEIGRLNNEIKDLKQRGETAWKNNYKVLKLNEKLKELHLKAVDECLEAECQNQKMRDWIERVPKILHDGSLLGISAKDLLASLDGA